MNKETGPDLNEIMYYQELDYARMLINKLDIPIDDIDHIEFLALVDDLKTTIRHIERSI